MSRLPGYGLCNKRFGLINVISSAVCRCLWKLRNHLCFQDGAWSSLKMFWQRLIPMLKCSRIFVPAEKLDGFDCPIGRPGLEAGADLPGPDGVF
jgi:hypothetical protein